MRFCPYTDSNRSAGISIFRLRTRRGGIRNSRPCEPGTSKSASWCVLIPKFASLCRSRVCELRNRRTLATYWS